MPNIIATTTISRKPKNGTNGFDGLIIRRTEWVAGKIYRNDSDREAWSKSPDFDGKFYLDEVVVSSYNGGDGKRFVCKKTHISSNANKPREDGNPTELWETLDSFDPYYTPFADITKAIIEYLQAKQLLIYEENEDGEIVPYGAFGGGDTPLWFGGESADKATFAVRANGTIKINPTKEQKEEAGSYMEIESVFGSVYLKIRDNINKTTIKMSPLGVELTNDIGNYVFADFNQITCYINRKVVFAASQNRVTILERNVYWDSEGYLRSY